MYRNYFINAIVYIGETKGYKTYIKVEKEIKACDDMEAEDKFDKALCSEFPNIHKGDINITSLFYLETL